MVTAREGGEPEPGKDQRELASLVVYYLFIIIPRSLLFFRFCRSGSLPLLLPGSSLVLWHSHSLSFLLPPTALCSFSQPVTKVVPTLGPSVQGCEGEAALLWGHSVTIHPVASGFTSS